ncbi:universal stress protein [Mycobacterium tilburgii]|uniref:universal stress protein n=1 Tax=Mycobacterium tilburgii TaxID=44467 RepID=UPI001183318F|nr:universal stress protein [Mycobacterium tilburgii]
MSAYQTVLVGTDGSDSSLRAADRVAADHGGEIDRCDGTSARRRRKRSLCHSAGQRPRRRLPDGGRGPVLPDPPRCPERAHLAGAKDVEEKAVVGASINALVQLAEYVGADLLVVGIVGLASVAGRLLGSVPSEVSRRSKTDVLIVHTSE